MKKYAPLLLGLFVCILVMVVSYFWATGLMDSVFAYRSPLHNSPPTPSQPLGSPNTQMVVIVLIDALRYDTSQKTQVMPFLSELRASGASALMHSRPPSYSEPSYAVLLTGAWPDLSDGPAINVDYAEIPTFTQDDIFSAAHRAGLQTAVSGYNWFEKLIPQDSVSASFYTAGEDQVADRQVVDAALPWLHSGGYQLVLIHIDQVDYAGHHEGGPVDPRWDEAATRADDLLREIVSLMDLSKDTLLVISDHGQIDRGGHGGQDAITLLEPFVLVGKNVVPGEYADVQMVDVAPTVAVLLGTNIPATNEGHPRTEMLTFTQDQLNLISNSLTIQQSQLANAYQTAIGRQVSVSQTTDVVTATQTAIDAARQARLNAERLPRAILGVILVILVSLMFIMLAKRDFLLLLGGVVIYLLIFNIKYALLDHKTYSLSSVETSTSLIIYCALTTLIALVISWLVFMLGKNAFRFGPRLAAEVAFTFILTTIYILSLPVMLHYVINGATVTWSLPNFAISFIGLLFLIQALMVAAIGLLLTGISALIGVFARKK
jgi:uncharacterized membrane protein (DUF485 family)